MVTSMRYPGGKGKCYPRLINLMPPHTAYIESHLGGGAVMRHKRPATINIGVDLDPIVIGRWRSRRSAPCQLVEADATSFLTGYPFQGGELVYADPPYLSTTRRQSRVYRRDYTYEDHEQLLAVLLSLPCNVMISGYDNDLYRSRLSGWRVTSFTSMTHTGLRDEYVWMNFPEPSELHETSFLGDNYRDRQTVKRRHQRLLDRFDRMPPIERLSVLDALNERFGRGCE